MTRKILVTGSSGAIGKAIVKLFRSGGDFVIGLDKSLSEDVIPDHFIKADLNDLVLSEDCLANIIGNITSAVGPQGLDVLVNNAAYQYVDRTHPIPVGEITRSHNINFIAPYLLITSLAEILAVDVGSVVNIGSVHSRLTKTGFFAYAATKAALASLTRSLAIDYGDKIRINCIEPASVATPMLLEGFAQNPGARETLESYHPQGRISTPQEVAGLVKMICDPALGSLHGACIDLSGAVASKLHDPA
ncbi:MAG: SDR family oxidoreductase [Betaproteobacteria bacterium]|nr:SDR family oxidoreductase [Betaproteobacteria bacterium]